MELNSVFTGIVQRTVKTMEMTSSIYHTTHNLVHELGVLRQTVAESGLPIIVGHCLIEIGESGVKPVTVTLLTHELRVPENEISTMVKTLKELGYVESASTEETDTTTLATHRSRPSSPRQIHQHKNRNRAPSTENARGLHSRSCRGRRGWEGDVAAGDRVCRWGGVRENEAVDFGAVGSGEGSV